MFGWLNPCSWISNHSFGCLIEKERKKEWERERGKECEMEWKRRGSDVLKSRTILKKGSNSQIDHWSSLDLIYWTGTIKIRSLPIAIRCLLIEFRSFPPIQEVYRAVDPPRGMCCPIRAGPRSGMDRSYQTMLGGMVNLAYIVIHLVAL